MKLGPNSKPHRNLGGYVCEMKAKLGGHVVIFDRENGASDIDADYRWIVMHMPSSLHVSVHSLAHAREIMKGVAKAKTVHEALLHADILPQPGRDADAPKPKKNKNYTDADRRRDIDRFWADPENEPSEEGKAALRRAVYEGELP